MEVHGTHIDIIMLVHILQTTKTKHIPIKYHFLKEQVADHSIKLEYIPTKEQVAYIFTKCISREPFEYIRQRLGVISPSQGGASH